MKRLLGLWVLGTLVCAQGCGGPKRTDWQNDYAGSEEDAFVTDEDFGCIDEDWVKVDRAWYGNVNGHLDETLQVARNPEGGTFPVGTVVGLSTIEAMVKRGRGFSDATADWEYFKLAVVDGKTVIRERGREEVRNIAGGCDSCHAKGDSRFDRICSNDRGCAPLPQFVVKAGAKQIAQDERCR